MHMRDSDATLAGAYPESRRSESLLEQAGSAILGGEYVRARKLWTEVLELEPHSILAYLERSLAHLKLAFPDLAAGDAYRALLLVDMIREGEEEIPPAIAEMEAKAFSYLSIALQEIGCHEDSIRYKEIGTKRYPEINFEIPGHIPSKEVILREGEWRREVYPWNNMEPDRFSNETLEALNTAMAKCSEKAELKVVDLPVLQRDLSFAGDGDRSSDKHLGVYAKEDIFLGETFFSEASPLTVVADPENSSLCEYCGGNLPDQHRVCDDCWEGDEDSGAMWCSEECRHKAFKSYHPALCGRDFTWLYRDINAAANVHPLALPDVKYLYGVSRPPLKHIPAIALPFNFAHQVLQPIQLLQEMDVDIFDPKYLDFFDLWVMQTVRAKFISVASARMSAKTRRTELAAVHTLYSMFNHSCEPTVTWECENEVKFTGFSRHKKPSESVAPVVAVKKGDECWTHYCDVRLEYKDRQQDAFGSLGGKCVCRRCLEEEAEDKRVNGVSDEE
ncbi:hypothetical protein C7212DRAFT_277613 [Tuber magnatum]|uniref:SET domain-containing protein n=1 Tax=Tuber magnatum TaxID=42249 RepID=A0A317SWR1_9PEZI|nr:hypothetical protein C7212DRAFT_277613 [Tuber magnatum]